MAPGRRAALTLAGAVILACAPAVPTGPIPTHPALVDDVGAARQLLEQERTAARIASGEPVPQRVLRLLDLGLFEDADSLLAGTAVRTLELAAAEAELRYRQYRFAEARAIADAVLAQRAGHTPTRRLSVRLAIQSWQLDWAAEQARALLARGRRDVDAAILLARVLLLQRDYATALEWAERASEWSPGSGEALVLASEAHFWTERPAEAERALRHALTVDPLNADARFGYGYALWRRGAPSLLTAMADQWRLALELDPLHHSTHWHLGNGHTPLTYADYRVVADSSVRAALAPVDSLIARGRFDEAIAGTRLVESGHPASMLPALWRGSVWYLAAHPSSGGEEALDSALTAFRTILSVAPNFGPAHNGVAAVLKQRQFRALASYDSLESAIGFTPVPMEAAFYEVFRDLSGYPGDRVARMAAQQLGPMLAVLPFLERQGQRLYIPPLHRDLAAATGRASLRTAATFDNRRWMDIRGIGGPKIAAAGIEYLERGSHLERGVLLHEFVHLVHASVFTEPQQRRVRELFLAATRSGRVLDYYAATNEQEFFAQAVEAFLSPAKVHPLNHKSLNTREDLRGRDPATFAFVEDLVAEMERLRSGDPEAMRPNRAQVYVNLAREAASSDPAGANSGRAAVLLDSALAWDPRYLPAILEYAAVERERGRLPRAEEWIRIAEGFEPGHPEILAARADLIGAASPGIPGAGDTRASLLLRAAEAERDPLLRAGYVRDLWELQEGLGRLPEAISIAEEYAANGLTLSSRLRDAREEARMAVVGMRLRAGYAEEGVAYLREKVAAAPLDFDLNALYADALVLAGFGREAEAVLQGAQDLLEAAGDDHFGIRLRLAEMHLNRGDTATAVGLVDPLLGPDKEAPRRLEGRLVRVLVMLGESTEAQRQLSYLPPAREAGEQAELAFTRGWISAWRGDFELAERLYRDALALDPYHFEARVSLHRLLTVGGRFEEARLLAEDAAVLPLPLGPAFAERLERE